MKNVKFFKRKKSGWLTVFFFSVFGVLNPCLAQQTGCVNDFDCDGIIDELDIDDDNDGIYDHIESPTCFYLNKSVFERGNRLGLFSVSSALSHQGGDFDMLIDASMETGVSFVGSQAVAGKEIISLTTRALAGLEISSLSMTYPNLGFFVGSSALKLQGSMDALNWVDLTLAISPGPGRSTVLNVTKNPKRYRMYRVLGVNGALGYGMRTMVDVSVKVEHYMPSFYPKPECIGADINGNGRPNHQDLDADGDSCLDVLEAGFLDPDFDGMLGSSPVTVDQNGAVISAKGYIVPNNMYWLNAKQNVCSGMGIPESDNPHCLDLDSISNDYGLIQSIFHSSIVKTKTGFSVFGEFASPRIGTPSSVYYSEEIVPSKGYLYTGEVLAATLGGRNGGHYVLSTDGLYVWKLKSQIPISWTRGRVFENIPMPQGVNPRQVARLSASGTSIMMLTKSGDVYIAAGENGDAAIYGDGSTALDDYWHKADIGQVVSVKIFGSGAAMALTISGELYTWGATVFLGNGSAIKSSSSPLKMTLPAAISKVKMTALTGLSNAVSYYILGDDKRVYSMGDNTSGVLGIGVANGTYPVWKIVKSPSGTGVGTGTGFLENIKFINATLHDSAGGAAAAIDESGVVYLWGENNTRYIRLGFNGGNILLPRIPDGIIPGVHDIIYVELGGHVSPVIDKKSGKLGYVGHRLEGSMGNGPGDSVIPSYDFVNTPEIDFCNIMIGGPKKTRVTVNPMNINLSVK